MFRRHQSTQIDGEIRDRLFYSSSNFLFFSFPIFFQSPYKMYRRVVQIFFNNTFLLIHHLIFLRISIYKLHNKKSVQKEKKNRVMNTQELIQQVHLSAKHNNIVRRAAVQSLEPVVKKVEQNIGYLLDETAKIKQKCEILEKTTYQHQVINKCMEQIQEQIQKIKLKIIQNNIKTEQESTSVKRQIVELTVQKQRLWSDVNKKQNKINDLFKKNTQQVNKLDKTSDNFKQLVEQYVKNVTKVQLENKKINKQLQKLQDKLASSMELLEVQNKWRDNKIQQSNERLTLYLSQRQEINTLVKDMWGKVDKAVDIERYENDWRIIRMENQEMKKQNKRMIDEALTPDVRAFLPEMLQRMSQIRKVNGLQVFFKEQKLKTDEFQMRQLLEIEELKSKIMIIDKRGQAIRQQLKTDDEMNAQDINKKLQIKIGQIWESLQQVRNESNELLLKKQKQIRNDLQNQKETLIENNRTKIFDIVNSLIPEEQKQSFNNLKKFSKEILPIVQNTKIQILQRCNQITQFGLSLEERLESFSNRITKIRGDMNLQIDNMKKRIKTLEISDVNFVQNFISLGKVISSYCELLLIIYSSSFDPLDKEVYITFSDGVVLERPDNEKQIYYRKLKTNKTQMKKAGLASIIKIVDSLLRDQEYLFMQIQHYRPSDFFKGIKQNIIMSKFYQSATKRQFKANIQINKMKQSENKLPSIDTTMNRTIQLAKQEDLDDPKKMFSETIASDLSGMRKKSKQLPRKERYSQIK